MALTPLLPGQHGSVLGLLFHVKHLDCPDSRTGPPRYYRGPETEISSAAAGQALWFCASSGGGRRVSARDHRVVAKKSWAGNRCHNPPMVRRPPWVVFHVERPCPAAFFKAPSGYESAPAPSHLRRAPRRQNRPQRMGPDRGAFPRASRGGFTSTACQMTTAPNSAASAIIPDRPAPFLSTVLIHISTRRRPAAAEE